VLTGRSPPSTAAGLQDRLRQRSLHAGCTCSAGPAGGEGSCRDAGSLGLHRRPAAHHSQPDRPSGQRATGCRSESALPTGSYGAGRPLSRCRCGRAGRRGRR
jgi:hypothetical protein